MLIEFAIKRYRVTWPSHFPLALRPAKRRPRRDITVSGRQTSENDETKQPLPRLERDREPLVLGPIQLLRETGHETAIVDFGRCCGPRIGEQFGSGSAPSSPSPWSFASSRPNVRLRPLVRVLAKLQLARAWSFARPPSSPRPLVWPWTLVGPATRSLFRCQPRILAGIAGIASISAGRRSEVRFTRPADSLRRLSPQWHRGVRSSLQAPSQSHRRQAYSRCPTVLHLVKEA